MKVAANIIAFISIVSATACLKPAPGSGLNKTELINRAESIHLVKALKIEPSKFNHHSLVVTFEIIQTLKGKEHEIIWNSRNSWVAEENHFNHHSDTIFWQSETGRSSWPCCLCTPQHHFEKGKQYLLFPGMWGAMMSAEVIENKKEDKWYQFVIAQLDTQ